MKVLVINCGSSSLKYQLMDMSDESVIGKGLVERIGIEGSRIVHKVEGRENHIIEAEMNDHKDALKYVFDVIVDKEHGVIESLEEITGIGHRIVHGGEKIAESVVVTEEVKKVINEYVKFAPLHNPGNLQGIEACEQILPGVPNVAVFDTAFHQSMPGEAYMYAIPYELYEKHAIRKYGAHGTSHRFIAERLPELMGKNKEDINFINCHLGNGASLCAVRKGESYDTTMGLTPLEGLIMGTRCGDIDPTVQNFLMAEEGLSAEEVNDVYNKKSGILGVSGVSSDFRDLEEAAEAGNERAQLALDMYVVRVKKYLGAYLAELDGVDAITFTAGLGENSASTRSAICAGLEHLGIKLDEEKNNVRGKEALISTDDSKIKVYVIPTDEELMIARDTKELAGK